MIKVLVALSLSLSFAGCHGDASKSKEIVGTWSWKPADQLPPDQVKKEGFPTPSLEAVKFTPNGHYVFVQRIPGYDSDVWQNGAPVPVPEEFHEWKGTWSITKGKLEMVAGSEQDRWLAKRRKNGWVTESEPVGWERSFEIVEIQRHQLRLHSLADFDFDRTFTHANAMPERPALAGAGP